MSDLHKAHSNGKQFDVPSKKIVDYVENNIIPYYKQYIIYKSDHVRYVMRRSLEFAKQVKEPIDLDMVYVIAAYHDMGDHIDRKRHEIIGAEMLLKDKGLAKLFTPDQLKIMSQAVLEHRASNGNPKSVYGKIVSSADRGTLVDESMKLIYGFRKKHGFNMSDAEILDDGYNHIKEKFGTNGYAIEKMFFKDIEYENFLEEIQNLLADKEKFKARFYKVNNLN